LRCRYDPALCTAECTDASFIYCDGEMIFILHVNKIN
jgi:hypothetical protein